MKYNDFELWERQQGEPADAFAAFVTYRDLGPSRSITKMVTNELGDKYDKRFYSLRAKYGKWSSEYQWVKRVEAWEDEQDRVRRAELLQTVRKAARRQAQIASNLLFPALERLKNLDPSELTVRDLLGFITQGIRIEREALEMDRVSSSDTKPPAAAPLTLDDIQEEIIRQREQLDAEVSDGSPSGGA